MANPWHVLVDVPPPTPVDTKTLFAPAAVQGWSPLDNFIRNTNTLNRIYLSYGTAKRRWTPELGNITLLGYMSAVESYVRAIITGLINVDEFSRRLVGERQVSFGLVNSEHNPLLLPEALLEHQTFSTEGKIEAALREFIGIPRLTQDIDRLAKEYNKLCQVRHCCVHRFGKLGSQNAWKLGFDDHRRAIEQPFTPSRDDTVSIALLLQSFVKALNNFIFKEVLGRTLVPRSGFPTWTWVEARDMQRFRSYHDLFAMRQFKPYSPSAHVVYTSFKASGTGEA